MMANNHLFEWAKLWPIVVTVIVGSMGYAKLAADVDSVKQEQQRRSVSLNSLPIIEYKVNELQNKADKVESILEELKRNNQTLNETLKRNNEQVDRLGDIIVRELNNKKPSVRPR